MLDIIDRGGHPESEWPNAPTHPSMLRRMVVDMRMDWAMETPHSTGLLRNRGSQARGEQTWEESLSSPLQTSWVTFHITGDDKKNSWNPILVVNKEILLLTKAMYLVLRY